MTSAFLIPDLKGDEGCRLTAYPDPLSGGEPWTIGYGCTGQGIVQGIVWTQLEADDALVARVTVLTNELTKYIQWFPTISDLRQDVLVNMAYNMGLHGMLAFHHTLTLIEDGNYAAAGTAMLSSAWAREVSARAKRLSEQMETNIHL